MKTLVEHINEQLVMELRSSKKKIGVFTFKNLVKNDIVYFYSGLVGKHNNINLEEYRVVDIEDRICMQQDSICSNTDYNEHKVNPNMMLSMINKKTNEFKSMAVDSSDSWVFFNSGSFEWYLAVDKNSADEMMDVVKNKK